MRFPFDVLGVRDNREREDDEDRPRARLTDVHTRPDAELLGIAPDREEVAQVSAYIHYDRRGLTRTS